MTREVAPLRAGDPARLGAYRLSGLLGEGGQGTVYLGEDEPGHRVAVKLLHARFSGDPKARSRFAAEVAVAKRVSAFCTARVLDSDVEGDRPYIVSEYIDGPSLSEVLAAEGPRRGAALDRLAIGTMTALAAIHQAGVVHRDFKPANVLLAPDGPRVIDFGIARALDATGTMSSTAVGTPAYMAPEQISGARVGPEADVFAWGATMAYAANGRPAFGQDSIPAVMHRILNLAPDLGDLHEPLRQIVADCLSKDPSLRPASQHVLAHLLDLAGSLPQAGAPRDTGNGEAAVMLTQGAATAATESARLHATAPPPTTGPPQLPGATWPPPPPPPDAQGFTTWPSAGQVGAGPQPPGGRKRGIGVLAGVGGAALVALILAGTAVAALIANRDHDKSTTTAVRLGGTLEMLSDDTTSDGLLDPGHASSSTQQFLAKQLFTGLTALDGEGVAQNRLATTITPDASCQTWRIIVRQGTTFSDGEPVDAEAFARGWARAAAVSGGSASYLMNDIDGFQGASTGSPGGLSGVKVAGPADLSVRLTSPNCEFPTRLANPVFAPVPKAAGDANNSTYNTRPVGNGPFKLESFTGNRSAVLVRNDKWAFGKTQLDRVNIRLTSDSAVGRAAFTGGEVDLAMLGSSTGPTQALGSDGVARPTPFTRMVVPLTRRGPLKSRDARLAVSYALDRTRIAAAAPGFYEAAHGIVPAAVPGGFGRPGPCPSCDTPDVAKAKELATRAKLGPGTKIRLYHPNVQTYRPIADTVSQQLSSALGWQVELRPTEFVDLRKTLAGKDASGLALSSWGPDYPTPYTVLWPLLGSTAAATESNGYANYNGWSNAKFDELVSRALRSTSAETRTSLYKEAEKIALDDLALIPLTSGRRAALVRKTKVTDLSLDYDGDPVLVAARLK
ncbi:ABC transporter substrate-binding protein [Actinomadura decatromicini]|uniref:Protein kinase n=1 Tax=Actinomadura decatromicini TaxID=2604572 RepID=A0A5D3FEA7_9ACTN|nr:ABC transporter substrate-binding protein [Actinomadura decatromicini]TYK46150.1 protein kinase [Actinomadura decatromicini]